MEPVEILKEARNLIEKGWTRGEYFKGDRCCTLGAIAKATDPVAAKFDPDTPLVKPVAKDALRYLNDVYSSGNFTGRVPEYEEYNLHGMIYFHEVNDAQVSKKPILEWFDSSIRLAEES